MGSKAIYLHTRQSAQSLMSELLDKIMAGKAEQVDAMYLSSTVLKDHHASKALFASDRGATSLIARDVLTSQDSNSIGSGK